MFENFFLFNIKSLARTAETRSGRFYVLSHKNPRLLTENRSESHTVIFSPMHNHAPD